MKNSTRTVIKAMGVFGSARALTILCSLVRNKLIAIWIGPVGVGLVILYNSISDLITTTTRLNTDQSAMRQVVQAKNDEERHAVAEVIRRWSLVMGLLGSAVMCALSPWLSMWSFGDTHLWWTFCMLAAVPLFTSVALGYQSIMQGSGQLWRLARTLVFTALAGIFVSVPLIWFLREQSIIWVIVVYALCLFGTSWVWRVRWPRVRMSWRQVWHGGVAFARLGFWITVGLGVTQLCNYLFVLYLNACDGKETLGLYQAGYTLVNTYVGIFFSGVWIEYYPRLTALAHTGRRMSLTVSHRLAATTWMLIPISLAFITAAPLLIRIVYASSFLEMAPYIILGASALLLRGCSWTMAIVVLARGDGHIYAITESVSALLSLVLNIVGYGCWGYAGLGISYIIWYGAYAMMLWAVYRKYYGLEILGRALVPVVAGTAVVFMAAVLHLVAGWWASGIVLAASLPICLKRILK